MISDVTLAVMTNAGVFFWPEGTKANFENTMHVHINVVHCFCFQNQLFIGGVVAP